MTILEKGGYLEIILGPMFSGKTSALIEKARLYKLCDISTCIINHLSDNRYDTKKLSSHNKDKIECVFMSTLKNLLTPEYLQCSVFFINEGQFFPDLYETVYVLVEKYKKTVYICGLDGDYQRKKFGRIIDLIPLANKVEKKTALCMSCKNGKKASFTKRLSSETDQIIIGVKNYIPVCRLCYNKNT